MNNGFRLEQDSIGELQVPNEAYYGVQSLRGAQNFHITGQMAHPLFIKNVAKIKKACAIVNGNIGAFSHEIADAIVKACDEIVDGQLLDQFIVDAIQGGAGTSLNMNANEVIANRATEILGGKKGDYSYVHPNDHVNRGQSTNDVIPSAGKMAVIDLIHPLLESLSRLVEALDQKAAEFDNVIKMGRTQLQDAVPIRLGQEFAAYSSAIKRDLVRIAYAEKAMHVLNMGGSAIGTCMNVEPAYLRAIAPTLSEVAKEDLTLAEDLVDGTQNLDALVFMSSALKTSAVSLSKIANDLRLLSSGPCTGIGEIHLPAKQNGSSIMPGKVNPVIPEVVSQVAFLVIGHDATITAAAEAGQMELNAFEPVLFYQLFESITAMTGAVNTFIENCITGITANVEVCKENVEKSVGTVTAMAPYIGYQKAAAVAKEALRTGVHVRELILQKGYATEEELEKLLDARSMTEPREEIKKTLA